MGKRFKVFVVAVLSSLAADRVFAADQTIAQLDATFTGTVHPFVQKYCVSCHGATNPEAEFNITPFSTMAAVTKDTRRWSLILERVEAKEMPPADAKAQPTADERQKAVDWIKAMRTSESKRNAGDPGVVLARRLSNAEYDHTIRDVTGVDIRPTKEFPVDPANEAGFDNTGESLAMSPSLVKKYLDAARLVSEHVVLKPDGIAFAPFPIVAETDRDKYAVNRIVDFYKRQPTDYAEYFLAAWRFANRAALGKPQATLADFAKDAKVSPKYLDTIYKTVTGPAEEVGPIAAIQQKWRAMPAPADGKEPAAAREGAVKMRDFIVDLRPWVRKEFPNFPARGIASGSQTLVLWKNRQYAQNRMTYAGNALQVNMTAYTNTVPIMLIPETEEGKAKYEEGFKKFCAVFPDSFYIYERARSFLTNPQEIARDLEGHRLLTAGFHSQMGYFRDDVPLCELILDDQQRQELDTMWKELDFITKAPILQQKQFVWFERAEPPSFMYTSEFNSFRSEDDDLVSEPKLKKLAELYLAKAKSLNISQEGLDLIADYFERSNTNIRALEKSLKEAEPRHIEAVIAFAEKAFRRPLTDSERSQIRSFYGKLRTDAGLDHEEAIRDTVASILMSPSYCFRINPSDSPVSGVAPLSDFALASRLSYFLWASMPDQELLAHAAAGDLHTPDVLLAQTRRMMKDNRIRGFATEFGGNWLDVRRFEEHNAVDRERFPQFTNELRSAMFEEPIRFIVDLVRNNGSILDVLYGDYTFVNPILAKHYGMPEMADSSNDAWQRIDHASQYQRGGILPMSVFMTKNAPGLRTSPVKRGYWVVRRLLGEHIPAPPPNVPVLPTDETKLGDLTLRETLAKHREDKACSTCHDRFDAVGVVFEGFGPIGEWRTKDLAGRHVEVTAKFPDGSEGTGLDGLRKYIKEKRQDDFVDNLCRKLLVYGLGRSAEPSDDLLVDEMRQKLSASGNRFGSMVETIVTSKQFLNTRGASDLAKE